MVENFRPMLARAILLVTAVVVGSGCAAIQTSTFRTIALQPYGKVSLETLTTVRKALEAELDAKILVREEVPLPASAYYEPRNRYRAEKLLQDLSSRLPHGAAKIMGITEVDISTTKGEHEDWGIFGLGCLNGETCVVSTFRLRDKRLQERIAKVAVHEIGHTFGLQHCQTNQCVMQDAEGKAATVDANSIKFCPDCRRKIK